MTKTRKHLNGKEIQSLIADRAKGLSANILMERYNITTSTFYRILRSETAPLQPDQKKVQRAKYSKLNEKVYEMFLVLRNQGLPVSGPAIKLLAASAKHELLSDSSTSIEDIRLYTRAQFSNTWLEKFNNLYKIRNLRVNGERASVPADVWISMAPIIAELERMNLPINRIYNWDETGIFYRALPKYTLAGMNDDGAGAKEDRQRITALICANGDGSDTSVVLIGKSQTPRNTTPRFWADLGIQYFSNKSAWMNSLIFNKLLLDFDARCDSPTVLILDNFSGHNILDSTTLTHVIPIYLPPNTTSVTQALDAGIIAAFKINYRTQLMDYICSRVVDTHSPFTMNEINIYRIAPWIKKAIENLQPLSIQKCFYRTLKLQSLKPELVEDTPDATQPINNIISAMSSFMNRDVSPEEALVYVRGDYEENAEEQVEQNEGTQSNDDEDITIPDTRLMLQYADILRSYFNNTGAHEQVSAMDSARSKLQSHLRFQ